MKIGVNGRKPRKTKETKERAAEFGLGNTNLNRLARSKL